MAEADWGHVAASQGLRHHQEPGGILPRVSEGIFPFDILILDFWPPECPYSYIIFQVDNCTWGLVHRSDKTGLKGNYFCDFTEIAPCPCRVCIFLNFHQQSEMYVKLYISVVWSLPVCGTRKWVHSASHRWGNEGTERLSDLPRFTWWVGQQWCVHLSLGSLAPEECSTLVKTALKKNICKLQLFGWTRYLTSWLTWTLCFDLNPVSKGRAQSVQSRATLMNSQGPGSGGAWRQI